MSGTIRPAGFEEIRPACPECHTGTIELVTDGEVGVRYATGYEINGRTDLRMERRPFGACNTCEFCIEIDTRELRGVA